MGEVYSFLEGTGKNPEEILIELCFHFSILIEYQLIDMQTNVRKFVFDMSNAIQEMDNLVVAEGQSAQSLFESLFNKNKGEEVSEINSRSNRRAEDIFAKAFQELHSGQSPEPSSYSDPIQVKDEEVEKPIEQPSVAEGKLWSEIAKRFESFCRLEERLRPQVYTMIRSLNFEDIQTQRLDHAVTAHNKLNQGMMKFLKKGLQNCTVEEMIDFSNKLIAETRASYTMRDERLVFDQVFIKPEKIHK